MKNKKLKRKFYLTIVLISIINVLLLVGWFYLKARPIINQIKNIDHVLEQKELNKSYNSIEELDEDILRISEKYYLTFTLEDINENLVLSNKNEKVDIVLHSKLIEIEHQNYLLKIYPAKTSISGLIPELMLVQFIALILILGIYLIYTRKTMLTPIDTLVSDIKNYKFGRKGTNKKLNNEFNLIQTEFINLMGLLEDEKKEQNRIIASISHDVKTPLTSIIGYSELIKDENTSLKEIKKYNQIINDKAIHMKEIINTFDDYLINQDNVSLKLKNVRINDLVNDLISDYKIELENKNIEFNINNKTNDIYIKIDLLKIKRVFSNIISNSLRYLSDKGRINIDIEEKTKTVEFVVSDNGPGVDEKIISKIFDPLFTTDKSRKISGLGLSICKEFIEMHKGKIEAYNENGLKIKFYLPKV